MFAKQKATSGGERLSEAYISNVNKTNTYNEDIPNVCAGSTGSSQSSVVRGWN